MNDLTLRILLIGGLLSLILGLLTGEHKEIEWIDGFAIILAVFIVVIAIGVNDL